MRMTQRIAHVPGPDRYHNETVTHVSSVTVVMYVACTYWTTAYWLEP